MTKSMGLGEGGGGTGQRASKHKHCPSEDGDHVRL